jgi:hypothetical protein
MHEKEVRDHLQGALNLYRDDVSTLKQTYEQKIRVLEDNNQRLANTVKTLRANLEIAGKKNVEPGRQIHDLVDSKNALQQDYWRLKKDFDECQRKIEELERENQRLRRETVKPAGQAGYEERRRAPEEKAAEYKELPSILEAFNRWAANPAPGTLPLGFRYAEGEFRIRSKNDYRQSSSGSSKWIVNTTGGKKYLLPNPLSFDLLTNISELYQMDMSRLQPSRNRLKVIKPCELLDEGYINYPGELIIL